LIVLMFAGASIGTVLLVNGGLLCPRSPYLAAACCRTWPSGTSAEGGGRRHTTRSSRYASNPLRGRGRSQCRGHSFGSGWRARRHKGENRGSGSWSETSGDQGGFAPSRIRPVPYTCTIACHPRRSRCTKTCRPSHHRQVWSRHHKVCAVNAGDARHVWAARAAGRVCTRRTSTDPWATSIATTPLRHETRRRASRSSDTRMIRKPIVTVDWFWSRVTQPARERHRTRRLWELACAIGKSRPWPVRWR